MFFSPLFAAISSHSFEYPSPSNLISFEDLMYSRKILKIASSFFEKGISDLENLQLSGTKSLSNLAADLMKRNY